MPYSRIAVSALLTWLVGLAASTPAAAQRPIEYEIAFPNAVHHEAVVSISYRDLPDGPLEVRMSRASPGRYALHEFARNVYAFRAVDGAGRKLAVSRPDLHAWDVAGHDGTVRITYTLFADRAGGTYSGIDATHAHLNMPATFAWARGLEDRPITVAFRPPEGSGWRVATQLASTDDPYAFTAPDFQYFMDSPTELSDFDLRQWTVESGGMTYTIRLALHHLGTDEELDAYAETVKKVVLEQMAVFGELPDFEYDAYTFIADYLPYISGDGMEHRNSTILASTRPLSTGARRNLNTVSHEFFHAWNMERIRARAIEPFDFERPNVSGELWFGEGFTSYYDDLILKRAGILSLEQYASGLAGRIDFVTNAPGRRSRGPVEMSQQAPFVDQAAFAAPTNDTNTFISYYTYGAAIGLGLELTLRTRFDQVTLDDYMRALWEAHGVPGIPYTLDDLKSVLGQVTGDAAFAEEFFARYIHGREIMDYEELLANAGFLLRKTDPGAASLGSARINFDDGAARIASSTRMGSPLYETGLDRGDRIVSLDGRPIRSQNDLDAVISAHSPGDELTIVYQQRSRELTGSLILGEDKRLGVVLYEGAGLPVTDEMRGLRDEWLSSKQ
jgi:predicted metalloprotease with PDZ domain